MSEGKFIQRISYKGNLKDLLLTVCKDFRLGSYESHEIIEVGYEDLNIILETDKGGYLVKALANFRDRSGRERYLRIMQEVNKAGINHPKLYKSNQGYLHSIIVNGQAVYLFVMQFIKGKTFYDLGAKPGQEEIKVLAYNAALINKINLKPEYVYDSWAVVNLVREYNKAKAHLSKEDVVLIEPVYQDIKKIDFDKLPHSFVHGDIISTNTMRDKEGRIWIIDFSVSNYYPRIQELAVLACDLLSDFSKPNLFEANLRLALGEYQKEIPLSSSELKILPLYIKAAHAMHIIGSVNSLVESGDSDENRSWLKKGRQGLEHTFKIR